MGNILVPNSRDAEGELRMRLAHVDDLRRAISDDTEGDDPVQELVVTRLLDRLRTELCQRAVSSPLNFRQRPKRALALSSPCVHVAYANPDVRLQLQSILKSKV